MEPIKHILKEKKHLARLKDLRSKIYTPIAPLDVAVHSSREPIPPGRQENLRYIPIIKKGVWGGVFGCAWFRVRGTIPESAAGKHVAVHINVGGEGAVYQGLEPQSGITSVMSYIDRVQASVGKSVIEVSKNAVPGEKIELYIDAGYNGYYNYPFGGGIFHYAELCAVDDELKDFYYDYLCAASLLSVTSDAEKRARLESALDSAYAELSFSIEGAKSALSPILNGAPDESVRFTATGHSHLDLAWLWPLRETKRKAQRTFANQLKNAERCPWYVYGASQPWQFEYIRDNFPGQYAALKELNRRGQLELQGGMYVECDTNLPSGEALFRQIYYGKRFFSREFGQEMNICWLPDVFGYNGNLPQIMKKCGLDCFMTIKLSWNEHNRFPYRSFRWRGIDGSEVLVHMPPDDSYNSAGSPACARHAADNYPESDVAPEALMLYGIGDGGGGPGEAHLELVKRQASLDGSPRVAPGTAREFFQKLSAFRDKLPVHKGELYLEKHQGTYTTQSANKRMNRECEYALQDLETLCTLAWTRGREYPQQSLDRWWKEVLLYQFHDILPGSSIKRVYDESRARYDTILREIKHEREQTLGFLASGGGFSAYNPTSFERTPYIKRGERWFSAKIAPHGFAPLREITASFPLKSGPNSLENELISLRFGPDSSISSALFKPQGLEFSAGKLGALRLYSDKFLRYNAWDIDWKYMEKPARTLTPHRVEHFIDGPRAVRRCQYRHGLTTITQDTILYTNRPVVYFETRCNWHETFKMLRADFDFAINAQKILCDIQMGAIERSTGDDTPEQRAQFEICAHKFVEISDNTRTAAIINNCKYGHRAKGGQISLNLLRSPVYPDPTADKGRHRFTYALYMGENGGETVLHSYALNKPAHIFEGEIGTSSIARTSDPRVVIETIKRAHSGGGVIIRLYNSAALGVDCTLGTIFKGRAFAADGLENELHPLDLAGLSLAPYEILTVKIK